MSQVSLSIVIPTAGRATLAQTLQTLAPQLIDTDEVFVVGDGDQPFARHLVAKLPSPPWHYFEHGPTRDTGNSQREFAIRRATCSYLSFMDDDDIYTEQALATIRSRARSHPAKPLMFRMEDRHGTILWKSRDVIYGNVGGLMIVIPNIRGKVGTWDVDDFHFIAATLALQGEPVWLEDVIAIVRPHEPRHQS
jgi:glycosyltransferase involved in cell wall biosynthesis